MKTKLVPFDIEKAKHGAKVVTRCGYPAEVKFHNAKVYPPIMCLVEMEGKKKPYAYTLDGRIQYTESSEDNDLDLFIEEEEEKPRREYSGTDSIYVPKDDEGIREELIDAINGLWDNDALPMPLSIKRKEAWLAWLQKQGEKNTADVTPKFKVTPKFTVWDEDENNVKKETKKRRMTKKELSLWLREHPEEFREYKQFNYVSSEFTYYISDANIQVDDSIFIRRNHGEWEEPLIEN